jgi:hypothetical protein
VSLYYIVRVAGGSFNSQDFELAVQALNNAGCEMDFIIS